MVNQLNFNSHPELNDLAFCTAAMNVYNGAVPAATSVNDALRAVHSAGGGAQGRFALVQGWDDQGFDGNSDDDWFKHLPSYAWLVAVPVAVVTGIVLVWRAWGHLVKAEVPGGNGNSNGY